MEYVDYGRLLRWPSYLNGTAFAQSDLTPEGWPTTDCSICVFGLKVPPTPSFTQSVTHIHDSLALGQMAGRLERGRPRWTIPRLGRPICLESGP